MTEQHPITPPSALFREWLTAFERASSTSDRVLLLSVVFAAGADQELEACCEWADATGWEGAGDSLRTSRRPKPPSLKEQALDALEHILRHASTELGAETIRRALEQLDD